jgi:hypothetical protein
MIRAGRGAETANPVVTKAASSYGKHRQPVIAVAIIVLALVLRLAWTLPPTGGPALGFAAAFGEHALCLAAAGDPASNREAPPRPAGHADHDAAKCCQSHAAGELVLPGAGAAIRLVFATPADRFVAADAAPVAGSVGHVWARAPPLAAG